MQLFSYKTQTIGEMYSIVMFGNIDIIEVQGNPEGFFDLVILQGCNVNWYFTIILQI